MKKKQHKKHANVTQRRPSREFYKSLIINLAFSFSEEDIMSEKYKKRKASAVVDAV